MKIIDLQQVRSALEAPDRDCVSQDAFGRPLFHYGLEYRFDGRVWTLSLEAYSFEEAERRVAEIRAGLHLYGQIYRLSPA
ncbi:hypothetical protein LAC81_37680 (plasmid) [Ensifer adhaerens]|uniref:hypothetical protein n=1 Tax=Ensifer adhaerens TaxID=106592 RepID=UPI001CC05791|nr:hypothetical protein [Ensifer adhaerens]MBZ7927670.1 hypothetical protein [Ensifer adhaerens]UAX98066.1 hypothetical protein LAC78_38980 [Ensifer adhaerens]UAY05447.1 hypothetical protein LAC80_37695 [Ensifer adhaerens]UAY12825.1 hypothetical protein LAC81_37680 [Ensifer adhaerens]